MFYANIYDIVGPAHTTLVLSSNPTLSAIFLMGFSAKALVNSSGFS